MYKGKMVVLGIVALLLVGAVMVLLPSINARADAVTGNITVYVQNMDTEEGQQATVEFGNPTFAEQMLMSFGQGVRASQLKPMDFTQTIPGPINRMAHYMVWGSAAIKLAATDIVTLTQNIVIFTGLSKRYTTDIALTSTNIADTQVQFEGKLVIGSTKTIDMKIDGAKDFRYLRRAGYTIAGNLEGQDLDKFELYVSVFAKGKDAANVEYTAATAVAKVTLTVGSWEAPSLTLTVTGMSASNPVRMAITDAAYAPMIIVGVTDPPRLSALKTF